MAPAEHLRSLDHDTQERAASSHEVPGGHADNGVGSRLGSLVEGSGLPNVATDRSLTSRPETTEGPYALPQRANSSSEHSEAYGPARRVPRKSRPELLLRPQSMLQDDFSELMREVLPELINQTIEATASPESVSASDSRRGEKREASAEPEPAPERRVAPRSDSSEAGTEDLSVEVLLAEHLELPPPQAKAMSIEALLVANFNKKQSKELPAVGNPLELQNRVDEAKVLEWSTVQGRNATRLVLGKEAQQVRQKMSHRIMGSRFVVTVKQEEDEAPRVKARWCLQGHLDPDLHRKALAGDLQSPTLSQVGRSVLFQMIASHKWSLRLGDIKGAFLSSGELPSTYRPLYARLPPGGIPGVPEDALIEVLGHVYGLNDAPSAWQRTLNKALVDAGFERSRFDPCIYYMRENGVLTGIYGVHVDDCATGGQGEKYERALEFLRARFEFRKWRLGDGDFCGARYRQDPQTFAITMSQDGFVEKLRPLHLSRSRQAERDSPLTSDETRCLRAINGGLNWLATQSRPDLSTQVSFSQQAFPEPCVQDALAANNAIRRARQNTQLPLTFQPVDPHRLSVMVHSDAAYANGRDGATQAGYIVGFTDKAMNEGTLCSWTPAYWRSYRLPRVVNSTLSAEAQAMSSATGMLEWILLLVSEALDGPSSLRCVWQKASLRTSIALTDCKSLYDHLTSKSAPTLDDKRTALDVVIVRDSLEKTHANLRWIPTDRMVADALTKESPEAMDLMRACLRAGQYQISDEDDVLELRASERARRKERAVGK